MTKLSHTPPGIFSVRGFMGVCHLLVDGSGQAVLIDTGLVGEPWQICRLLRRLGLRAESVAAILLTHGHLDHVGNLAWARNYTRAPVFAHRLEKPHVDGVYPYRGTARWCGRLERLGYGLLRYRPAAIDHFIADGDILPFWGGLRVVHLPGHTLGHCGFFSESNNVLFSGDLFASCFFNTHLPPPILNSAPALIPDSLRRVRALQPRYIVPQHYDFLDGSRHRRRFEALCRRQLD